MTETTRASAATRILALPGNGRREFFDSLFSAARAQFEWQILVPQLPELQSPRSWESDPQAIESIDALIAAAERASGLSAGRVLLIGETDIGRGFSEPNFRQEDGAVARRALNDNAEPFVLLRRMFAFARDTLDGSKPDVVLAGDWAEPLSFTFYMLARQRSLRCVSNRPSPIWPGRVYWTEDWFFNLAARARVAEKRNANAPVSANAQDYLATRRSAAASQSPIVPDFPYIYFALQCEPARSLGALSPFWANQYNAVTLLSAALPAGYRLLVQDDAGNKARRPERYLKDIRRLPNVTLVDGTGDLQGLIANAALVAATNDAVGWEALVLGRRVLALTDNFYEATGLVRRLHRPELLAPTVIEMIRRPAFADPVNAERALGWLIDAEWETSFPSEGAAAMNEAIVSLGDRLSQSLHSVPKAVSI